MAGSPLGMTPPSPAHCPTCPAAAGPGSAWAGRPPGVARGEGSEWSQGEGGAGLWPKCRLGCHRPSLLATSPAPSPSPSQAGQASSYAASSSRKPPPSRPLSPGLWAPPGGCCWGPDSSLALTLGPPWFVGHTGGALFTHVGQPGSDRGPWRWGLCRGHGGTQGEEWGSAAGGSLSKQAWAEDAFPAWAPCQQRLGSRARWGQAGTG